MSHPAAEAGVWCVLGMKHHDIIFPGQFDCFQILAVTCLSIQEEQVFFSGLDVTQLTK